MNNVTKSDIELFLHYLGGGFGAGCFFLAASPDTTVERGAVIRLEDLGMGPVIFTDVFLAG